MRVTLFIVLLCFSCSIGFAEEYDYNADYEWKNVAYGGGGFVTG